MDDADRFKVRLIDGGLYDPWSPSGPVPSPETIFYGLARLNRYCGATTRPYSVAEHSLWVALFLASSIKGDVRRHLQGDVFLELAHALASPWKKFDFGQLRNVAIGHHSLELTVRGLLHDAPEGCGLVDLPSPIGRHEEMKPYKQAHVRCTAWLFEGWGLSAPYLPEEVEVIDKAIVHDEVEVRPMGVSRTARNFASFHLGGEHDLSRFGDGYVMEMCTRSYYALGGHLMGKPGGR